MYIYIYCRAFEIQKTQSEDQKEYNVKIVMADILDLKGIVVEERQKTAEKFQLGC